MDTPAQESSLNIGQAADAFSSFFDDPASQEESATQEPESLDAAAERLASEEAATANQNNAEEGEQQPAEEVSEDGTVEIEVDGKPVKLTKAEMAEHYKNGLRQKDYTQKTMATAEEAKAAKAEREKAHAEREHYAQQLNNYVVTSESILAEQQKVLTEELLRNDPVEYLAQERTFRERQANAAKAQQELARINGERQQEQQQAQAAYEREQLAKLHEALPEWKDPKTAKAEGEKIAQYLASQGWEPQDIGALSDHRHVLAARKAMLFDNLMARAKETQKQVQKAPPKVERPGTPQVAPTDGRTRVMKSLKASGSINDAAAAFGMLG